MPKFDNARINVVFIFVVLAAGLVFYRLFTLSYLKHSIYSKTSQAQQENINNILARGNIYLQNPITHAPDQAKEPDFFLAVTNKKFPLAYLVPSEITSDKKQTVVDSVVEILGMEKEAVSSTVNSKSSQFKVLVRKISTEQVEKIKALKIKGFAVSYEMDRFYSGQELASNVMGFLGYGRDGLRTGQYGIEAYYDKELFGQKWQTSDYLNPANIANSFSIIKKLIYGKDETKEKGDRVITIDRPSDVVLTIDKNIQSVVETKLEELLKKWNAAGGSIIVQDPHTGKILAMADRPTFNPNSYKDAKTSYFLNRSTQEVFEPGSSFKPIMMAMGLDLGKVTPQTTFTDIGFVDIAGYKIKNFSERVFGLQTMTQVLENSVNTGAMHVQTLVGDDNFLNYVINMGFGQKSGIDLPGEVNGDITNLYSGRKINYLTASFGQGIAVTPIQLVNAYSAIANGGKLMKPYIVEKIIKEGGEEVLYKPEIIGIPISEKTSTKLKTMLVSVVDNGFDKARIKGYDIAGKTGTAQIPDGKGGYAEKEFIHDFLGFAPAYDPKFVILIKMDKPQGIQFAADSLSPTFRELAAFLINYYNIPPTRQ